MDKSVLHERFKCEKGLDPMYKVDSGAWYHSLKYVEWLEVLVMEVINEDVPKSIGDMLAMRKEEQIKLAQKLEEDAGEQITMNQQIKIYRRKENLTQQQLSEKLGCKQSFISMIENDEREAPAWLVVKCGEIFGETFKRSVSHSKQYWQTRIFNMCSTMGVDKLRTIDELCRWAVHHGVVVVPSLR